MSRRGHPRCGPASLVPPRGSRPATRGPSRSLWSERSRADTDPWRAGTATRPGPPCYQDQQMPPPWDPRGSAVPVERRSPRNPPVSPQAARPQPKDCLDRPKLLTRRSPAAARPSARIQQGRLGRRGDAPTCSSRPPVCSRHHHNVRLSNVRARLSWVSDQEMAVEPIDAGWLEINLADLVRRQAQARPEAVALVQPGPVRRTMTWAELDRRVDGVAAGLSAHGLLAGHRIAICGPNSIEFVVAYFATLR